eukprot:TRINITY_DN3195_c1_g2_i5.p1 TRINITY_DN3195_c1_g2~~TRINITY_DN3195_c1_g2_i5.p1  ORF type:complete len:646 (+),score=87.72 TRINITY_DN3195_c1_g2_i5:204-2141(+)
MILYDYGDYSVGFIWQISGSTLPLASAFAFPAAAQAMFWRWALNSYPQELVMVQTLQDGAMWTASMFTLGLLLSFRTNKAYARFWEGMTLVQRMRAEWFESCSNLMAFSNVPLKAHPDNKKVSNLVLEFRYTLVHVMSLMHGAALRQIGGNCEEFDVLDIQGLDRLSMEYLNDFCSIHSINRVEVLLHWIQVLITDNIASGVLIVPPPILTRAYQTLSRGMVNLHDVRKLAEIPFPFPLSQMIIALLLIQSVVTPLYMAARFRSISGAAVCTFLPLMGMWSITFIAGQMEQPFGQDPNDLPLSNQQFEMNNSLLMLLDDTMRRPPSLNEAAHRSVAKLRETFGDPCSRTDSFAEVFHPRNRQSSMARIKLVFTSRFGKEQQAAQDGGMLRSNSRVSTTSLKGDAPPLPPEGVLKLCSTTSTGSAQDRDGSDPPSARRLSGSPASGATPRSTVRLPTTDGVNEEAAASAKTCSGTSPVKENCELVEDYGKIGTLQVQYDAVEDCSEPASEIRLSAIKQPNGLSGLKLPVQDARVRNSQKAFADLETLSLRYQSLTTVKPTVKMPTPRVDRTPEEPKLHTRGWSSEEGEVLSAADGISVNKMAPSLPAIAHTQAVDSAPPVPPRTGDPPCTLRESARMTLFSSGVRM